MRVVGCYLATGTLDRELPAAERSHLPPLPLAAPVQCERSATFDPCALRILSRAAPSEGYSQMR